ncbi:UDP-N-acetylglucosamine 2-epimerase (hydrolyzing) [Providencia rettgeri]|uniref:UDP-N-acetylglucosamine 2-epimerase n=1 Tax=Providencia rettgeri TaxID=587 RepID=UPI00200A4D69|nr:UDP-N-acetylglucosamine 2-epimerase [Providencia rettgeri]MBZ3682651.1 UDP-N-acetylglucosamine 2-epimerase (hydrolyzing) [Providencia rettgeri]UPS62831.1 UDP-N-acetylglucosamine 2-epimerase [Providencia rettgeri]
MKVAIITSTRADFGLLFPLIKELEDDIEFDVTVIATGSHLDHKRGYTVDEIYHSGINNIITVETDIADTSDLGISITASDTLHKMSLTLDKLDPDLVIILGDRYEMLSTAFSAFLLKKPIAHISGGDITSGALDDSIRHSITKLSSIHFTTTETYKKRVIQLGEEPSKVFNVGNLCIDNFKKINKASKEELENFLGFNLSNHSQNILVTLHPETTYSSQTELNTIFFTALKKLKDTGIIITYPNHDAGSDEIIKHIQSLQRYLPEYVCVKESLGMRYYHSLLQYVNAVIGNSSSGITEVPSYGIPTIDVGNRQEGRIRANSVFNCSYNEQEITALLKYVLEPNIQSQIKNTVNPYGDGNTSEKIVSILKKISPPNLIKKKFYDI